MAKRKPVKRKPRTVKPVVAPVEPAVEIVPQPITPTPVKPDRAWLWWGGIAVTGWLAVVAVTLYAVTPRGVDPPKPEPTRPVVTLEDTPAAAVAKSHARYILNFGDSLDEFAELAPTFGDSAAAAKWFTDRTARARAEAFGGKDGFDAYVFGHAGGDENGEDRYDAKTLAKGAKEMAEACRAAAVRLGNGS